MKKIGLWGVTRFPQLEGIPLLGGYGGSAEGLWSAYSTIMGEALVQIPAQKRPLPIERDKPVRALFMKFHFIPPWQPFKQWLWGNVPPRMSNNSQDQQLFCAANTLIKRLKIFLPESIKERSMKDTCKQEQKATQTKVFCPKDATFVSDHNHLQLCAAAKTSRNMWPMFDSLLFSYETQSFTTIMVGSWTMYFYRYWSIYIGICSTNSC